jgi:phosphotriesterase-related protein
MASVMGVNGPILETQLGFTLPHEHLFTNLSCYWSGDPQEEVLREHFNQKVSLSLRQEVIQSPWAFKDNTILDDLDNAMLEAEAFIKAGGRTIVDASPYPGMGRNPSGLLAVSIKTGANVIMSTGRYSEPSMNEKDKLKSVADLVEEFISEFIHGAGDSGVQPGLLKVGFVDRINKEPEIRSLRAAGKAQGKIGCALTIHPHIWEPNSHLILDILEEEGCDLRKAILCHQDFLGDKPEYLNSLVKRGAYIEFDTFGSGLINDRMWKLRESQKIQFIKKQIEIGNVQHLLISGDMCLKLMFKKWGGKGLANIPTYTLPAMRASGISEDNIQRMVLENPKRVLCY